MACGVAKRNKRRGRVIRSAVVLKSISSVSTCESHWPGAARLPLLRVRIGLQATSDVDPAECPFRAKLVILSGGRSLPVSPGKQTISEPVSTSHLCHNRTHALH